MAIPTLAKQPTGTGDHAALAKSKKRKTKLEMFTLWSDELLVISVLPGRKCEFGIYYGTFLMTSEAQILFFTSSLSPLQWLLFFKKGKTRKI